MAQEKGKPIPTEAEEAYLTFLPALEDGYDPGLHVKPGIVSGGAQPAKWLADLARHLRTDNAEVGFAIPDVMAAEQQMRRCLARAATEGDGVEREAAWRGILALALLWDGWEKDDTWPSLTVEAFDSGSAFGAAVTGALRQERRAEGLRVLTLSRREEQGLCSAPLGLVSWRTVLTPAADPGELSALLPMRVTWYDRDQRRFLDPCAYLNESDRGRLMAQLSLLQRLNEEAALASPLFDPQARLVPPLDRFLAVLGHVQDGGRQAVEQREPAAVEVLTLRIKAVCGLMPEAEISALSSREESYANRGLKENPLVRCFLASGDKGPEEPDARSQMTYLWNGVPFARESATLGLEATHQPGEAAALAALAKEIALLEDNSPRWNRDLAERVAAWLDERVGSQVFSPAARQVAEECRDQAKARAGMPHEAVTLTWPWDRDSGAVRLLLREALGEAWVECAMRPFADQLAVMPECPVDALGDAVLRERCRIRFEAEGLPMCAALPPMSAELTRCLAEAMDEPETVRVAFLPDSLCFAHHARPEGGEVIEAAFTLRGKDTVRLSRAYAEGETCVLPAEEAPTIAVWPCIPFARGSWKSYYTYVHQAGEVTAEALSGGQWTPGERYQRTKGESVRRWSVQHTERYPAYLLMRKGSLCVGALPNLLPPFLIRHAESAVVAVDFGTTGTTVMLRQGERVMPLGGPTLLRTLLHGDCASMAEEFLPGTPAKPVMLSAEELFTDDPDAWQRPLVDGHAYQPDGFEQVCREETGPLYYDLKWGVEAFRGRVNRLYLAQVMQAACLAAMVGGAPDVSWRIAMPGAMALEGRRAYWNLMNTLAREVADLTGVPLTPGVPPVSYVPESLASGMYFRSRNEVNVRGGFITLDVGGGSAELSLWLRGIGRPVASCSLPLGAQFMLLDSLLQKPQSLTEDFAALEDPKVQAGLEKLCAQLAQSHGSLRALQKGRLMLDTFLGENLEALSRHMNAEATQGRCTMTQALLLMNFAFLMMLAGQMQEQAYNDPTLNDLLPAYMEVCVSGRGSLLMLGLDSVRRQRLGHFIRLSMSADHPTREHPLVISGAPKMEVATGLIRLTELDSELPQEKPERETRGEVPIAPAEMMTRFLKLFRAEFPDASARLFGDVFQENGEVTRRAGLLIQTIADNQFSGGSAPLQVRYAACLTALRQHLPL